MISMNTHARFAVHHGDGRTFFDMIEQAPQKMFDSPTIYWPANRSSQCFFCRLLFCWKMQFKELIIVFSLKFWNFSELSSAAALVFYLPGLCTHTLTPRENRERPESGIFYNLQKKTQYLMNTLYKNEKNC